MIKKLIVLASILLSLTSWAQDNTASPYSYFGLGEVKFKGTEEAKAMGGISIVADSTQLNLINPAYYSKLRYTTFAIGGTNSFTNFYTNNESDKSQRTSLDYLLVAIPKQKFGVIVGLMPFSTVGFKLKSSEINSIDQTLREKKFLGNGNINRVLFGTSYKINSKFSVGFDINYNFGKIKTETVEFVEDPVIQLGSRERNTSIVKGFSSSFGVTYEGKINNKLTLYSSLTFSPESKLYSENTRNIATIVYGSSGNELIDEEQDVDVQNNYIAIPTKLSIGSGIGVKNKWLIATEITLQQTSKLENRFKDELNGDFKNATKIALGGFFIPKYNSFSSYFSRITYRAGLRYENTGLVLKNESINDYGMTFGLGLPVGLSKINIGFELGKKGTTTQNLIQENYFNLNIGLSLSDLWFRKREIN
ncbi:hypothetical protein [uncultured Flavobacterium sp.]|uniref:hypothetical protein n=1 Tax=uncultured Flavobacterium sp. TaxID=165435 RepID=UPI002616ED0B|nr:hypothetical protein [uncultured Flavobacterium sp.]